MLRRRLTQEFQRVADIAIAKEKAEAVEVEKDNVITLFSNFGFVGYDSMSENWSDIEINDLIASAEAGDSWSQYQLGAIYATGDYNGVDFDAAIKWYRKSAQQDNPDAQYNLGLMYILGEGIDQDSRKGFEWLEKSALNGDFVAEETIGGIYENGLYGFEKNTRLAIHWYQKAVAHGNAKAKFVLGMLYLEGGDIEVDQRRALSLIAESYREGYVFAIDVLREHGIEIPEHDQ